MLAMSFPTHQFQGAQIQAPLAGYSHAGFRRLVWRYGQPSYCCTEMLPAALINQEAGLINRYTHRAPEEKYLCYQLSGACPKTLALATAQVCDMGADLVDLNAGCPKRKIRRKGAGSALVDDPEHLLAIVQAMRASCPVPLTLKLRLNENLATLLPKLADAGIDAVTVHARDRHSCDNDPAHWSALKDMASKLPLIINGGIDGAPNYHQALNDSQASGVMIGRAGFSNPWLVGRLDQPFTPPSQTTVGLIMLELLEYLSGISSERAAWLASKSVVHYYRKHLDASCQDDWVREARACTSLKALRATTQAFFNQTACP